MCRAISPSQCARRAPPTTRVIRTQCLCECSLTVSKVAPWIYGGQCCIGHLLLSGWRRSLREFACAGSMSNSSPAPVQMPQNLLGRQNWRCALRATNFEDMLLYYTPLGQVVGPGQHRTDRVAHPKVAVGDEDEPSRARRPAGRSPLL
jgi:hypothetical protein